MPSKPVPPVRTVPSDAPAPTATPKPTLAVVTRFDAESLTIWPSAIMPPYATAGAAVYVPKISVMG
ncbi:hypothetical protein U2092_15015, partial [Listeria monocytogenes]